MSYNINENKLGGKTYKITIEIESFMSREQVHNHFKEQLIYLRRKEAISAISYMETDEQ